jgi:tetratricopeptide (TPR) repeat protein
MKQMDARTLFREGVVAIRDEKDLSKGRDLLVQSLRLDPQNEQGWLWLSRTVSDPQKRLQALEKALRINPQNTQAIQLVERIQAQLTAPAPAAVRPVTATTEVLATAAAATLMDDQEEDEPAPTAPEPTYIEQKTSPPQPKAGDQGRIKELLQRAEERLAAEDAEGAIEQWVRVLELQVDHEEALGKAVRHLSRLKYMDDARELVWRALDAGTQHPSVYLTAIDIARVQGEEGVADELRLKLAALPDADEKVITRLVEYFLKRDRRADAIAVFERSVERFPKNQAMLKQYADLLMEQARPNDAMRVYEQVARLGAGTQAGKEADKKLLTMAPGLGDKERGSVLLAVREAAGFGVLALLMAWQDAGLNLLALGPARWFGVILSVLGGYLLITATSSAQQKPLASMLGGVVPPPPPPPKDDFEAATLVQAQPTQLPQITLPLRLLIGAIGSTILVIALYLVFSTSVNLTRNPDFTDVRIPTIEELLEDAEAAQ